EIGQVVARADAAPADPASVKLEGAVGLVGIGGALAGIGEPPSEVPRIPAVNPGEHIRETEGGISLGVRYVGIESDLQSVAVPGNILRPEIVIGLYVDTERGAGRRLGDRCAEVVMPFHNQAR